MKCNCLATTLPKIQIFLVIVDMLGLPQNSKLKCSVLSNGPIFPFSSCYCYFAQFKAILSADIVFRRLSEKLMSSHWKLFLSPCHKV